MPYLKHAEGIWVKALRGNSAGIIAIERLLSDLDRFDQTSIANRVRGEN